jgi:CRISPR-associated protein Cmr6
MNELKLNFRYYLRKATIFQENELLNILSMSITHGSYLFYIKNKEGSKTSKEEGLAETFEEGKRQFLEFLVKNSANYFKQKKDEISRYLNELKKSLQEYIGNRGYIREIQMRLTYRGTFGVSSTFGQIPFEVGLYIHPYFNVPYIPASSIKGAIRSAYHSMIIQEGTASEREAEEQCDFIFGDKMSAGLVGFTDALPIEEGENGYILYPDIINPHYKNARDEMSVQPNPIIFLTVAPGAKFKFYMYVIKERENRRIKTSHLPEKPEPDLNKLGWLDRALLYGLALGVGAKTALGYSQFEVYEYE